MTTLLSLILLTTLCWAGPLLAQDVSQDELPDDYVPFTFCQHEDRLEGASPFLEGFQITMDIPRALLGDKLSVAALFSAVRNHNIVGTLTYPAGKTTPIEYEIVHHRETEDIYMKSSLGHFLWEYMSVEEDSLNVAIYWWYSPPATTDDLAILEMTQQLLGDSTRWHQDDDRECAGDLEGDRWSLFCALKHSSLEVTGDYNHHNTAMQTVRFVIDDIVPNHEFEHTLMDYNNAPSTRHCDVLRALDLAKKRIKLEIQKSSISSERPEP